MTLFFEVNINMKPDVMSMHSHVLQMDPSDTDYDPDPERDLDSDGENNRLKEETAVNEKVLSQLDFYQADPFTNGDRTYQKLLTEDKYSACFVFPLQFQHFLFPSRCLASLSDHSCL